jgi:hypothetical protein
MALCPECSEEFERLGLHWWHGSCPYPEIAPADDEMFRGLLMGDGSIPNPSGGDNCVFRLSMTNRRFLDWFDDRMGVLTTGVSMKKTASELASNNRETGFSPRADERNYHDMHSVWTRTNPYFDRLRQEWYTSGDKRFPDGLELTPRITKFWYASDGYLDVGRWGRPRIEIKASNERDRAEFLVSLFKVRGFDPTYKRQELRFTCDDTERLVNWMGDPPPGFEYKWAIESRERYRELKKRAYSEYTTQTFGGC